MRSAKKRKFSAARRAWPLAWVIGRPESYDSISASSCSRLSTMSAILLSTRARSRGSIVGHGPSSKAFFAAATARSMSAFLPEAALM
ncbi:Uncharacterised protein [Mycobacteroides abscessus subsp. abscessus]|nr:Uncharacterised protein [Mycobacteroides abscessus subsp. abscessus]